MINCRKINDEKNIFEGLFTNMMFVGVWIVIAGMQAVIVEFFYIAFDVSLGGLPW